MGLLAGRFGLWGLSFGLSLWKSRSLGVGVPLRFGLPAFWVFRGLVRVLGFGA